MKKIVSGQQYNPKKHACIQKGSKPGYYSTGPASPAQGNNASTANPGSEGLSHPNQSKGIAQRARGVDLTTGEKV